MNKVALIDVPVVVVEQPVPVVVVEQPVIAPVVVVEKEVVVVERKPDPVTVTTVES
jgi:hypothetical protein